MSEINLKASFTARLECLNWGKRVKPVMLIESVFLDVADSGWLCLPERYDTYDTLPVTLRFEYIKHTQDRFHYRICCATDGSHYDGRFLDSSLNRFLGFYSSVRSEVFWKIEQVGTVDRDGIVLPRIVLRDHLGYPVRVNVVGPVNGEITYLSTVSSHSDAVHFTLVDYRQL